MKMDYEKAYKETIEQLYIVQSQMLGFERKEERMDMLFDFSAFIEEYGVDLKKMPKQSEKAKSFMKKLIGYFNRYGEFYFAEVISRRKQFLLEKELLEAYSAINALKAENEKLLKSLEFSNL